MEFVTLRWGFPKGIYSLKCAWGMCDFAHCARALSHAVALTCEAAYRASYEFFAVFREDRHARAPACYQYLGKARASLEQRAFGRKRSFTLTHCFQVSLRFRYLCGSGVFAILVFACPADAGKSQSANRKAL